MDPIALRPAAGCRLILPDDMDGATTLDGLSLAAGADVPAAGALVPPGVWATRRLDHNDAEPVPDADVARGRKSAEEREAPPRGKPAPKTEGAPA